MTLPSSKHLVIHIETSQLVCFKNKLAVEILNYYQKAAEFTYKNSKMKNMYREIHYLGADFCLGLLELSARFDILLSTAKVEFSLFA